MMPVLLPKKGPTVLLPGPAGRVIALDDPSEQATISLPPIVKMDPPIPFAERRALITSIGVSQQVSSQFVQALGGGIFIYVFGDRPGQMLISGLAVPYACTDDGNNADVEHGLEKMLKYYAAYKLSARRKPVLLKLSSKSVLKGFLIGFDGRLFSPENKIVQFNMTFVTLPEVEHNA